MATLLSSARSTKPIRRPIAVELTMTINGVAYLVTPIAPGPDNVKAFRLVKQSADEQVYDVCQTTGGLVECDCPSFEATYRGNGLETCKHGRALIMVGLVDYPTLVANLPQAFPAPIADEFDEPAEIKCDVVILDSPAPAVSPECDVVTPPVEPPARVVPVFDREPYRIANIVAKGGACWLIQRPRSTREPMPAPATGVATGNTPAEPRLIDDDGALFETSDHVVDVNNMIGIRLVDDDGTLLETSAEMDARHEAEHAAKVAELLEGNPFLPTARQVEPIPCCEPAEAQPCEACATVHTPLHTLPDDLSGDDWGDGYRWEPIPGAEPADEPAPDPRSLGAQIDIEVRHFRTLGTPFGDLIARHLAELADRVRFLGATTFDDYQDRYQAMLDSVRSEAEARSSARC